MDYICVCKCQDCQTPHSHTTAGHLCEKCKNYGHGINECEDVAAKEALIMYHSDKMWVEMQCSRKLCRHPWSHTTCAHHCDFCQSNHSSYFCHLRKNTSVAPGMIATIVPDLKPKHCKKRKHDIECPVYDCFSNNNEITQISKDWKEYIETESKCVICMKNKIVVVNPYCLHMCV